MDTNIRRQKLLRTCMQRSVILVTQTKRMRVLQLSRGDPVQMLSSICHVQLDIISLRLVSNSIVPLANLHGRTATGKGQRNSGTPPSGQGKGTLVSSRSRREERSAIGSTSTVDCWLWRTPLKQAMRVGEHFLRVANGSGPVRILHVASQVSNWLCKAPTQKSHLD